jgi:hypothetical protein
MEYNHAEVLEYWNTGVLKEKVDPETWFAWLLPLLHYSITPNE